MCGGVYEGKCEVCGIAVNFLFTASRAEQSSRKMSGAYIGGGYPSLCMFKRQCGV
jgi:hypothetical protein